MGAVYQAKDVKRQQLVAVKEMGLSMIPLNERAQAVQNFKIEAKMLANLNHANLPTFSGFFAEGQRYFTVMEYIDGATLEELLERNRAPFSERRVLGWARQLCDVLEYLHNQQPPIIFRDMKPGNIMLTRDGHIKLIDFGIARFFRPTSSQDTQLLGTPGFAPPEQYGKTQTDERSDIYSLAITLFQLLTNTLSETGFGLRDVRATNPAISPQVAHALEKAASLEPEDRYSNIAEFRRALLGEGSFVFENGEVATTVAELAEICLLVPQEAAGYLVDGEIEAWLREIGELDLLRTLRHIRSLGDDPQETLQMFVQAVLGSGPRSRSVSTRNGRGSKAGLPPTLPASSQNSKSALVPPSRGSKAGPAPTSPPSRGSRGWLTRKPTSPVLVSPSTLDFGVMYAEVSTPMVITIAGDQGFQVSGSVDSKESWILLDREQFDGIASRVEIRVDGTRLAQEGRYTGQVRIIPDGEGMQRDIVVKVEAEIVAYPVTTNVKRPRNSPTLSPDLTDLDELDFEEDLFLNNRDVTLLSPPPLPPTTRTVARRQTSSHAAIRGESHSQAGAQQMVRRNGSGQTGAHAALKRDLSSQSGSQIAVKPPLNSRAGMVPDRHTEYIAKYGNYTQQSKTSHGWDPIQISATHRTWIQRVLTAVSAFMLASLGYTLLCNIFSPKVLPLPPNPLFMLVLTLIVPAATLGAMLVNWNKQWNRQYTLDCISTGLVSTLLVAALVKGVWMLLPPTWPANWVFLGLLLLCSIAATAGTNSRISENIMYGVGMAMAKLRAGMMAVTVLFGGLLGYVLTMGFALSGLTPFGILLGIGTAVALVLRVDQSLRRQSQTQN